MNYSNNSARQGFTLIELLLAMTFLSAILLFSTLIFIQALATYNKGLTIKQINETGRSITTDLSRSSSGAQDVVISGRPIVQFICVGRTGYMWNVHGAAGSQKIQSSDGSEIGLVRTKEGIDVRKTAYCNDVGGSVRTISAADFDNLVGTQARVLDVEVSPSSIDKANGDVPLVRLALTIGTTSDDGALTPTKISEPVNPADPSGPSVQYWKCPADSIGNFCAVGEYSTTIYLASGA